MKALYADDILLTPKTHELPEPFKVKKFTFTEEPIPDEYKFENMSDFVREIPMEGYVNKNFVKETLVREFEDAYNLLTPVIIELNDIISDVRKIIKKSSVDTRKFTNLKEGQHYLNLEPYRKFFVILPVFINLRTSLNAIRLSILTTRLSKLVSLQKLCKHLAENPRYYHINIHSATQNWKALEFDYMPDVFSKYIAFRNQLDDMCLMLDFIPRPFANDDANKNLFLRLINCHLKMRDPVTGYIPYAKEFEILALFLDSKSSPFVLKKIKSLDSHQFKSTLARMHAALTAWCGIKPGQRSLNEVVKSVVARMLFDKYRFDLRPIGLASASLQNHISNLSKLPLSKIGMTEDQVPEKFLDKTAAELFRELPDVSMVPDSLLECLFCTNPVDAAFRIYRSGLALAGMLANIRNERIEKSQRFDDLFACWKSAIIAAEIPEPDQLFQWLSMFKNVEVMPPKLAAALRIPRTVVKTMLSEALSQNADL
jgi:hypothetical protein